MKIKLNERDFAFILRENGGIEPVIPKDKKAGITIGQIDGLIGILKDMKEGNKNL